MTAADRKVLREAQPFLVVCEIPDYGNVVSVSFEWHTRDEFRRVMDAMRRVLNETARLARRRKR